MGLSQEELVQEYKNAMNEVHNDESSEIPPRSRRRGYLLAGVVFAIILLLVVYSIVGPVWSLVVGHINSQEVESGVLEVGDGVTVRFLNETDQYLEYVFLQSQEQLLVETSACLEGKVYEGNRYEVTSIHTPPIYDQSRTHVRSGSCPNTTIIMLHTHPTGHCTASETDIHTLDRIQQSQDDDRAMLILCDKQRYSFYTK